MIVDLTKPPYSLSHLSKRTFAQRAGSITAARTMADLKHFVGYAEWQGQGKLAMTTEEILAVGEVEACALNAMWETDALLGDTFINFGDGCGSRAEIIYPHGTFKVMIPLQVAFNRIIGGGTGTYSDGTRTTGGTRIEIDHTRWLTRVFPERNCMQTENYMRKVGYQESYDISGFRFIGGRESQAYTNAFTSYGFASHDAGETAVIEKCYSVGFNSAGFHFRKGTPGTGRLLSSFCNSVAGFYFSEGSVNTFDGSTLSGDDNPALIMVRSGGGVAGGTLNFNLIKSETGTRTPYRGQIILDAQGAFNIVMSGVSAQVLAGKLDAAFVIDPQGFPAQLDVRGFRECGSGGEVAGYTRLLQDGSYGWSHPGYCVPISFLWSSPGLLTSNRSLVRTASNCKTRLGFFSSGSGTFNYTNCSPAYAQGTAPPQPACTYTTGAWSAWSACTGGIETRTRTVTASPAGCTGTPPASVETRTCSGGTTPPSTGLVFASTFSGSGPDLVATTGTNRPPLYSWSQGSIASGKLTTNGSTSFGWSGTATRIVYRGLTLTSIGTNWERINNFTKVQPDGKINVNGTVMHTMVAGQKIDLDITVPAGVTVTSIIGSDFMGADPGGTQLMSIESIEVYA